MLITCLIKYGVENDEWRVRKESLDALTKLMTRDTGGFDQGHLVVSLISRLRDVSDAVVQQAIMALIHIKNLIGEDTLVAYVRKLSGVSRQLFRQYQGRIMGDKAEESTHPALVKKSSKASIQAPVPTIDESVPLAITGSPSYTNLRASVAKPQESSPRQSIVKRDFSAHESTNAPIKTETVSEVLHFGYIPEDLLQQLQNDSDWKIRAQAIEQLFKMTQSLADPRIAQANPTGLFELLAKFLQDSNFKMVLTSIHIMGQLIDLLGKNVVSSLTFLCSSFIFKLSDNKAIIRQASTKMLIKLMHQLDMSAVLEICLASASSDNPRIREEIVNLASTAFLTFPKNKFNFRKMIQHLFNSLKDSKAKIKFVAMESFAIIASLISPEKVLSILDDLGLDQETGELLKLRFEDPALPQLNADGVIQHTISRSNAGTPAPSGSLISVNRDNSKLHIARTNSKLVSQESAAAINVQPQAERNIPPKTEETVLHRPPDTINPLESHSPKMEARYPQAHRQRSPDIKRARSFSDTDALIQKPAEIEKPIYHQDDERPLPALQKRTYEPSAYQSERYESRLESTDEVPEDLDRPSVSIYAPVLKNPKAASFPKL